MQCRHKADGSWQQNGGKVWFPPPATTDITQHIEKQFLKMAAEILNHANMVTSSAKRMDGKQALHKTGDGPQPSL